ncbi:MAG: hypothetical protein P8188_02980 [Gemmatimonadota bacterium]|jgi:hypothetical protein
MDFTLSVVAAVLIVYALALNIRALTWVTPEYRRRREESSFQIPLGPMPWEFEPRGRRLILLSLLFAGAGFVVVAFAAGVVGTG